eukprot:gnl/TRDRNA2_/TRDRNA2_167481_c0_seq7.p1 gnl/TRDRNA2_/TRDRNA2_167481_c0~~gnl/TRDRNA2_/TRDRNA2_167481_c0_seq7.p1  ORF type:complete len:193 (-),score=23.46 gnl/TRDRNA2_/TRDRNA2_167481_c0_seq7:103-681(-)
MCTPTAVRKAVATPVGTGTMNRPRVFPTTPQLGSDDDIDPHERRVLVEDGNQVYSFRAYLQRFRSDYPEHDLRKYWRVSCKPDESERRFDPEGNGKPVTFAELAARYPRLGTGYLSTYWRVHCKPAEADEFGDDLIAAAFEARESKEDPADGKHYTLSQLREKYKGRYNEGYLRNYWRQACYKPQPSFSLGI